MRKEAIRHLLIRAPNWIGDAVMSEPALSYVRELFPAARISLLAKPAIADLLANHPAVDELLVYDTRGRHAGLGGKWTLAGELKRHRFNLAILFQNAFEAALIAWLAGIPHRYGYATDGRGWLLTEAPAAPRRDAIEHHVHYYLGLLRPLGAKRPVSAPRLFLSEQEGDAAERRLTEAGLGPGEGLLGLNPGSTYGGAKRWLPERFADTADRLAASHGLRTVIVGAPGEESLGRAIAEAMRTKAIVMSGRTSIRELMAIISRCRAFVTNDTGPMHIAAAFGVPVVSVFGPTDARSTAPFGSDHRIVREPVDCAPCLLRECPIDHRCMTGVSVDRVYEVAAGQLQQRGTAHVSVSDRHLRPSSDLGTQHSALNTQHSPLKGVTVFLDRDGTLNRDTGYIKTPDELHLLPGVVEAIARLNHAGIRLVLVTNQSGIARGWLTSQTLEAIHARLGEQLSQGGAWLDGIYHCPHHPDEGCTCRKPLTGMITRAVKDLGIDLSRAYVVGDQKRDAELAQRIGARSVMVTTGPATDSAMCADYVASSLSEAFDWIVQDAKGRDSLIANRSANP